MSHFMVNLNIFIFSLCQLYYSNNRVNNIFFVMHIDIHIHTLYMIFNQIVSMPFFQGSRNTGGFFSYITYINNCTILWHTACPRNLAPFYVVLMHKVGQDFLDMQLILLMSCPKNKTRSIWKKSVHNLRVNVIIFNNLHLNINIYLMKLLLY